MYTYYQLIVIVVVVIGIMSGRGRGRNGGRGRHSNRGNNNNSNNKSGQVKPNKKTLENAIYYLGAAKQATDYETTTDFLINHIKQHFDCGNDIGTALEELEEYDIGKHKSMLYVSYSEDAATKEYQDKQFEMEFKAKYDVFMKRKQALEFNMSKAYSFLWSQCAKGMQSKIEALSDYNSKIKGNPIELLKTIKQHALNYQEHRYEMSIILDALRTMINTRQKENE
jgi:hypothetical protein